MVGGISSLLAQITGEKPAPSPRPSQGLSRPNPPPKRKAEDDLRSDVTKRKSPNPVAQAPSASAASRSTVPQRPRVADKPSSSLNRPTAAPRPGDRNVLSHKASTPSLSKSASPAAPVRPNGRPSGIGSRPAAAPKPAPATDSAPKAAPKKGSFAEIMARGQRAQAVMGNVGKIQHKKLEKVTSKQEKEDLKAAQRVQAKNASLSRPGSAKPGAGASSLPRGGGSMGQGARGAGALDRSRPVGKGASKAEAAQPEKKRRVPVSTGYAGTARPKPTTPSARPNSSRPTPTGGVLLKPPKPSRYSGAKRDRYEEEDEDMSDFIDYDDEEEEQDPRARRYRYDSEGSSDMEAGLDEIDEEEERATYIAKKDDWQEMQLEKKLKAEKERRKRETMMRGRR